jgi:hypothetical protein
MIVHEALRKIRLLSRIIPQNGAWGENRATLAPALMDQFERQTRERLDACLAELNRIRPATLLREDILGRTLDFRTGLPYFERTLELYHRLSRCDLDLVSLARLENITDDAETTVDQFRKILSFTGEDVENPGDARDLLIKDVRDSFERISTNVGIVLSVEAPLGSNARLELRARGLSRAVRVRIRIKSENTGLVYRHRGRGFGRT